VLNDGAPNQQKENAERWKKPEIGWTKLNVDASFIHDEKVGAWGAVLRDKEGEVVLSAWGNILYCNSADIVEATACLEGVKAIIPFAVNPLIIESDNSILIKDTGGKRPYGPGSCGHWSRLPNRDQLLGTNAGPSSSTNRD
jgi:hypothetical protein